MIDKNTHENVQATISYGAGCFGIFLGKCGDMLKMSGEMAQDLALIIGCGVIIIRFLHDGLRFIRYAFNKNREQ